MRDKTINNYWVAFNADRIYTRYKFEPHLRGKVKTFITNATLAQIVKDIKSFIYLATEQKALIISENGLPELDGKFIVNEVWVSMTGLLFVCKVRDGFRLTHRNKNVSKLRRMLSKEYNVDCEVDLED